MTDFDATLPWSGMKRCNVADNGTVNAYYGDGGYIEDGSNGQVMVEIPKFYYRTEKITGARNTYKWYISDTPITGFKVHPAFIKDTVEKDNIYLGAYEATAFDVTADATEVNTITVTGACTANGNLTVTLDGNNVFTVAVANGDDTGAVATKLRAATYTGYQQSWTPSGAGNDCILTCSKTGLKTTATIAVAATGVTASVAKSVSGAGGYMLNDPTGRSNTATTGDKLASVSGVKPISGWKTSLTITEARVLAANRGAGWCQESYLTDCAVQLLYLIEYASFNSQSTIGIGVTAITDDTTTNMAVYTGQTSALGNASGAATGKTHYQTAQAANSVSYRGIENFWGNHWRFSDGLNIKADRNPWVADHDFAVDTFAHPYVDSGMTLCSTNGYVTDIALDADNDYQFLASSVAGGPTTKALCDYYYQTTGNRMAVRGGAWNVGANAGAFIWCLADVSGDSTRTVGARLQFVG